MTRFPVRQALCQTPPCIPYVTFSAFLDQSYDHLCFANEKSETQRHRLNEFPKAHREQAMRIQNIREAEPIPIPGAPHLNPGYSQDLDQCALGLGGKPTGNSSFSS